MSEPMSKKAIKRRVKAAEAHQKHLVSLVDRCDAMIEDMQLNGHEPADVFVFRDLVLDRLHGAEEELSDACTSATQAGIRVHVRTRDPISLMRALHNARASLAAAGEVVDSKQWLDDVRGGDV